MSRLPTTVTILYGSPTVPAPVTGDSLTGVYGTGLLPAGMTEGPYRVPPTAISVAQAVSP